MSQMAAHVFISVRGRWGIMKSGARRASRRFDTRKEAIRQGRALAKREGLVLYIHGEDGSVQSEIRPKRARTKK